MANGDTLSPGKTILACVGLSVGIVTIGLSLVSSRLDEHGAEQNALRAELVKINDEIERRTDQRYRATDAERDLRLVNFRFERNERNIDKCLDFIEKHKNFNDPTYTDSQEIFWGGSGNDADPPNR